MGVTSYQHRELGIAESMVKIASITIRKHVAILGLRWPDLLPQVTLQINNRISERTGASSFMLMYNRPPNIARKFEPIPLPDDGVSPEAWTEWKDFQMKVLHEIFPVIADRSAALKCRQHLAFNRAKAALLKQTLSLAPGTVVAIFNDIRSN